MTNLLLLGTGGSLGGSGSLDLGLLGVVLTASDVLLSDSSGDLGSVLNLLGDSGGDLVGGDVEGLGGSTLDGSLHGLLVGLHVELGGTGLLGRDVLAKDGALVVHLGELAGGKLLSALLDLGGRQGDGLAGTGGLELGLLEGSGSGLLGDLSTAGEESVGVEGNLGGEVGEGVVALDVGVGLLGGTELGLDLVGVDDAVDVGVGDGGVGEGVAGLLLRRGGGGAEDVVELSDGAGSPDDEAADGAAGGELEEVEVLDVGELDTGEVAEGTGDTVVVGEDDQGTLAASVGTATELRDTSADVAGVLGTDDIGVSTDSLKGSNSSLSLADRLDLVLNNKRDLTDVADSMAAGHHEGRHGGSGKSGSDGVTLDVLAQLAVPAAPDLGGLEALTTTALVGESTLAGAGSTTTADTGNAGDGATSAPGDGGVAETGEALNGVGLAAVLGHVGVHKVHNILTDRGSEDGGGLNLRGLLAVELVNRQNRTHSGHARD